MPIDCAQGVSHLWFIDPLTRTLEAYRIESQRYSVLGTSRGDAMPRIEPFDAFALDLAALWSR